ncbi:MAG: ABC transporter ATP-binding protein [Sandaracinus sp.]|nr:ABC transporter ATP-binding protein [Sandaracinus sp.]MCB9619922.1 ABC transporter ATP-binding protein [Sandaracinus sp.]
MIVAENVSKWFGAHAAVRELTFEAPKGALVGLLGLNGAGKTTTLRMLAGLTAPTSGSLRLAGHDAASKAARAVVGYLPDRPPLWPDMRVRAFVTHAARLRGRDDQASVDAALERAGLREVAGEPLDTLSHGYRQRVGLAQALVHDPAVLVLDEPIQGLDPEQIAEMRATLDRLRGERTIVLSTHILGEVARSCDHLLVLHEGRVAVSGAKDDVLGEDHALVLELRGEERALRDVLEGQGGVASIAVVGEDPLRVRLELAEDAPDDVAEQVARRIVEAGLGLRSLARPAPGDLEALFARLRRAR